MRAMKLKDVTRLREQHGIIIMMEKDFNIQREAEIAEAQKEIVKETAQKVIKALREKMATPSTRKLLRTFGMSTSLAVQRRMCKLDAFQLYVEETGIEPSSATEAQANDRKANTRQHDSMRKKVEAVIPAIEIAEEANALLLEEYTVAGQPQLQIDDAFRKSHPPYGFWTALARRPRIAAAFPDGTASYAMDGNRGMVLKESLQELYGVQFLQNYRFSGSARTFDTTVETLDGPVTVTTAMPNLNTGIATKDEAHELSGGTLHLPDRVKDGRACTREDIAVENLTDPNSPFFKAFDPQDVTEAIPRALGIFGDMSESDDDEPDDILPTLQVGSWVKASTPGLVDRSKDAQLKERGFRHIKTRHPEEAARTHIARMAHNGALNDEAIHSGKTLRMRAVLCPDHESYGDHSAGVCQVVFYAGDDDETQSFFDEVDREKVQLSMMSQSYPLYNVLGLAEAKDGYKHIEAPLIGVIRRLLFKKSFVVKGRDGIDFTVIIDHCGCGSLTADEKARLLALSRKGGGADVFSFADVFLAGYTDYEHLSTSKVLDVEYLMEMMQDYASTENIETDEDVRKEWLKKYPGFEDPCWQFTGSETQEEIEQMFGSLKSPVGAADRIPLPAYCCCSDCVVSSTHRPLLKRRCIAGAPELLHCLAAIQVFHTACSVSGSANAVRMRRLTAVNAVMADLHLCHARDGAW